MKGANLKQNNDVVSKTGFAELSLGLQWGPDLLAFRPYLFVEPYVGYGVTGSERLQLSGTETSVESINKALSRRRTNSSTASVPAWAWRLPPISNSPSSCSAISAPSTRPTTWIPVT